MKHLKIASASLVAVLCAAILAAAAEGTAGGIRWSVPAGWQTGAPQPMRAASYSIPAAPGAEAGGCGVFFFGTGQGGTVDENIKRWASQFEGASAPKTSEQKINGLAVHRIEISGTYLAPSGPMMQSQGKKTGWLLNGAIIEAPDGLVFFKNVGPAATMKKAQPQIEEMLKSIAKAGAAKA